MGVSDTLGAGFTGIDGELQNSEDLYIDKRPYRRVQQSCHTRSRQGSWGNVCVTRCVCEYNREHRQSCVRTAGDIVSTAVGIIQYWEGTPHRVLISVLLYSDLKTLDGLFLVLPDEVL